MNAILSERPALAQVGGVSHIAIFVSDLNRSAEFYARVLGFDIVLDERNDSAHPRIFGLIGGFMVELMKAKHPSGEPTAPVKMGLAGFAFQVNNLDHVCAMLHAEGRLKVAAPKLVGELKMVFIQDPDGSYLELVEYPSGAQSITEALTA